MGTPVVSPERRSNPGSGMRVPGEQARQKLAEEAAAAMDVDAGMDGEGCAICGDDLEDAGAMRYVVFLILAAAERASGGAGGGGEAPGVPTRSAAAPSRGGQPCDGGGFRRRLWPSPIPWGALRARGPGPLPVAG